MLERIAIIKCDDIIHFFGLTETGVSTIAVCGAQFTANRAIDVEDPEDIVCGTCVAFKKVWDRGEVA